MTTFKISSLVVTALVIVACHSSKKTTSSTATATPTTPAPPATPPAATTPMLRPSNGVIATGDEQLTAIKAKYPDATLAALSQGQSLYTGACTGCHKAYDIYEFSAEKWVRIIDHMAPKARLTDVEKDALSKYVFSIKATQPK